MRQSSKNILFSVIFFLPSLICEGATPVPSAGSALIYPSPASGNLIHIVYDMPGTGSVLILVYNEAGDLVAQWQDTKAAGLQESQEDIGYFHPGVYFYRTLLTLDSGTTQKLKPGKFAVVR